VKTRIVSIVWVLVFALQPAVTPAQMDTSTVWPLCGRITENPPQGWVEADGCPAERQGDPAFTDAPFSSTFGPRLLGSGNDRYDFHRGVDIATPIGTPIFAIDDGTVKIAGEHDDYSDPLIKIRHYRPGESTCSNGDGCYHSYYLHLRPVTGWVVAAEQEVQKGQLIGYSGESGSGFDHLHFEMRDAPVFDPFSAWSRDAVHPFTPLPYCEPNHTGVFFNSVDDGDPNAVTASVRALSNRYDLVSIKMRVLDQNGQEVLQPGNTANNLGYHIDPPFWDM
jgi:murein DD-endopeptidase MepM/ murein hydrolase activator NlpD